MKNKAINILLIEDNLDDILLLQDILVQTNGASPKFKFHTVHRLDQGLEKLKTEDVDLIVLDLSLPDCRGMETLVTLQTKSRHIPIVVLTAVNDEEHALEAVRKGAQDFLVKGSISPYLFIRAVLHAIERSKIHATLDQMTRELRTANGRLEKLVQLDPLTELLNRRGLQDALSREIQRAHREESDLLALILDLDDFKHVNDTLGHAVGDVVLKEISEKLKSAVRVTDYVARIGGDEFLILMPQTRLAEGVRVAEKVRRAVSSTAVSFSMNTNFKITASLGLVAVTGDIVSIDELLSKTHVVLYRSKGTGKNRVSYEYGEKSEMTEEEASLENILSALRREQSYHVLKQPIFRLGNHEKVGYEFLSRFSLPGMEMPDDFFRVCLENNILTLADRQCLSNGIRAGFSLPKGIRRHFNLFPSTIIDIPVRNLIEPFSGGEGLANCCIEISEQQIIGDPSYLTEGVKSFKDAGILVAIDDVGFGRSCLESLILLEPDVVKIDKKWVNGISKNQWCLRSLKRVLKVTGALGVEVIAEGIETSDDMEVLKDLGVEYGQGYFLGRPL